MDFVGSGGTYAGCTAYFKEQNPDCVCIVVEPQHTAPMRTGEHSAVEAHRIQGGGYNRMRSQLPLLADIPIDGFVGVSDDEAISTTRALARQEGSHFMLPAHYHSFAAGIFAGFSAGANVFAALQVLRERARTDDFRVGCVICDSGLKYLSTDLFA